MVISVGATFCGNRVNVFFHRSRCGDKNVRRYVNEEANRTVGYRIYIHAKI